MRLCGVVYLLIKTMGRTATAKKRSVDAVQNGRDPATGRFGKNNSGRPKGTKNKTTRIMLESAREAFDPMARLALTVGYDHLKAHAADKDVDAGACGACQHWAGVAIPYVYGKPSQPLDIDSSALREQLEALATEVGKTVEELEYEAEQAGIPLIRDGRRVA